MALVYHYAHRLRQGVADECLPPELFVERGPYRIFAHPIYVGFCLALYGIAAYTHSSSTFYLIAPTVALATAALALGYENIDMKKRFKYLRYEPFVGLVHRDKALPDRNDKMRFAFGLYLVFLFFSTAMLGLHGGALGTEACSMAALCGDGGRACLFDSQL